MRAIGYKQDGFVCMLGIETDSGLELRTKNFLWLTATERQEIIDKYLEFAESLGVDTTRIKVKFKISATVLRKIQPKTNLKL